MTRHFLLRLLTALLAGWAGGWAGAAQAQDEKPAATAERIQIQLQEGGKAGEPGGIVVRLAGPVGFWLGLVFDDEDRLKVERVHPGSPAEKAGFKPGDIVVASGGTKLKNLAELQQAVELSGGKPLDLIVSRDGKELALQAEPVGRPGIQRFVLGEGSLKKADVKDGNPRPLQFRIQQLTEPPRIQPTPPSNPRKNNPRSNPPITRPSTSGWRLLQVPNSAGQPPVPDDLEITIKKKGRQPARIKVRQDGVTWTVSEEDLDKLPESVRGHVRRMLPGHQTPSVGNAKPGAAFGFTIPTNPGYNTPDSKPDSKPAGPGQSTPQPRADQPGVLFFPAPTIVPTRPVLPHQQGATRPQSREEALQKQLRQLQQQLHELQEQVKALRAK